VYYAGLLDRARAGRAQGVDPIMSFSCRSATAGDADAIADVFSRSFRLLTFLPMLHSVEEERRFIETVILKECDLMVAEDDSGLVSFLARPDRIGLGAGTQLVELAKASGVAGLELWCFQANLRARRFYEARGFRAIRFTDGENNEERMPDTRYRWDCAVGKS
jgi:GNAT superfamily N-acetyltransferase